MSLNKKRNALIEFLKDEYDLKEDQAEEVKVDDHHAEHGDDKFGTVFVSPTVDNLSHHWRVCTERQAEKLFKREVRRTLWAFNADYLANFLRNKYELSDWEWEDFETALEDMQEKHCERINPILKMAINPYIDQFLDEVQMTDGRGHIISAIDGCEHHARYDEKSYVVYRGE